jgi:DUF218 domain
MKWLVLAAALGTAGCIARLEARPMPPSQFDVVVIPGCPSEEDGALSRCQIARAVWGEILWRRGVAHHFITSGAAVHSPYVEADAIAQAMEALGVPADRIYLEPDALHTDENMYYSARLARALGFRTVAVASNRGHAAWGCRLMLDWGQSCGALSIELDQVVARRDVIERVLGPLRARRVVDWVELAARERERAVESHRRRPPSYLLYPYIGFLRLNGETWVPYAPHAPSVVTWAARARALARAPLR